MKTMLNERVFVYGALRRGEYFHYLLQDAVWLGNHRTPARYTLLDLGPYPGVIKGGRSAIMGELYAISKATLKRLDWLENHPREYRRERIATPFGCAWMYIYQRPAPRAPVVASGDWRQPLSRPGERLKKRADR